MLFFLFFLNLSKSDCSVNDGQEEENRALVDNFVEWTRRNQLLLNVANRLGWSLTLEGRGYFLHLNVDVKIILQRMMVRGIKTKGLWSLGNLLCYVPLWWWSPLHTILVWVGCTVWQPPLKEDNLELSKCLDSLIETIRLQIVLAQVVASTGSGTLLSPTKQWKNGAIVPFESRWAVVGNLRDIFYLKSDILRPKLVEYFWKHFVHQGCEGNTR